MNNPESQDKQNAIIQRHFNAIARGQGKKREKALIRASIIKGYEMAAEDALKVDDDYECSWMIPIHLERRLREMRK